MALPENAGGLGYGWVELAIVLEELGRHAAPGPFAATVTQYAPLVAEAATQGQAAELLAPVAAGRTTGTIAVDEGAGTWDPADVNATARRDGDDLVLAGTKHYVVDGATADEIAVVARLDGDPRVVLVPGSSVRAVEVRPIDPGVRHSTVSLDGVRVPAERLLGDGDATDAIRRALEESVTAVAAVTLGACQRIFDIINAYAKERIQFGVPIGSFQAVKHKLADMYRDIERTRVLVYYAALTLAEDHPDRTHGRLDGQGGRGRGPAPLRPRRPPARRRHRIHLGARPAPVPAPGQGRRTPLRLGLPPPPRGRPASPPGGSPPSSGDPEGRSDEPDRASARIRVSSLPSTRRISERSRWKRTCQHANQRASQHTDERGHDCRIHDAAPSPAGRLGAGETADQPGTQPSPTPRSNCQPSPPAGRSGPRAGPSLCWIQRGTP